MQIPTQKVSLLLVSSPPLLFHSKADTENGRLSAKVLKLNTQVILERLLFYPQMTIHRPVGMQAIPSFLIAMTKQNPVLKHELTQSPRFWMPFNPSPLSLRLDQKSWQAHLLRNVQAHLLCLVKARKAYSQFSQRFKATMW